MQFTARARRLLRASCRKFLVYGEDTTLELYLVSDVIWLWADNLINDMLLQLCSKATTFARDYSNCTDSQQLQRLHTEYIKPAG